MPSDKMPAIQFRNDILFHRLIALAVIASVICISLWISLDKIHSLGTQERLEKSYVAIGAFAQNEGFLPQRLGDIRVFFPKAPLRDTHGNRFSYTKLTDLTYVIRSFGSTASLDEYVKKQKHSVVFIHPDKEHHGWSSPNSERFITRFHPVYRTAPKLNNTGKQIARLAIVGATGEARLLVTVNNKSRTYLMHSRHSAVEEFTWIEQGNRLIYTAGEDPSRSSGIYLWDLEDDTETRIYPQEGIEQAQIDNAENTLAYSLEGKTTEGDTYFFGRYFSESFSPSDDESSDHKKYVRIKISPDSSAHAINYARPKYAPFAEVTLSTLKGSEKLGDARVPPIMSPPWLNAIDEWQNFSASSSSSAVSQAGTWVTLNLYVCALLKRSSRAKNSPLRAFAQEISQAVAVAPGLPLYQKLGARQIGLALREGRVNDLAPSPFCKSR